MLKNLAHAVDIGVIAHNRRNKIKFRWFKLGNWKIGK